MLKKAILYWLPLAAATCGLWFIIMSSVQQNYRQSLNDPQIEIAEDGVRALEEGASPADIVPRSNPIDAGLSLEPFIAVYDKDGTPLESSAIIDNAPPKPPFGVFQAAKDNAGKDTQILGENRVTWQPNETTRIALVVKAVNNNSGYFVASGRNMREVEIRENQLMNKGYAGLLGILIFTFLLNLITSFLVPKI